MAKDLMIAALVAEHRQAKGWSQEALAAEANISVRTLQRLERGETQDPATIDRVALALGITRDELKTTSLLIKALPTMIRVPRVTCGADLAELVRPAYGFMRHFVSEKPQVMEAANILAASWEEWDGILDEPGAMAMAAENFSELIAELETAGGKVFATLTAMDSGASGEPFSMRVLLVAVRDIDYPLILQDELGECTYIGTTETQECIHGQASFG